MKFLRQAQPSSGRVPRLRLGRDWSERQAKELLQTTRICDQLYRVIWLEDEEIVGSKRCGRRLSDRILAKAQDVERVPWKLTSHGVVGDPADLSLLSPLELGQLPREHFGYLLRRREADDER